MYVCMYVCMYVGYYLATLEAATQHILDLANQFESVAQVDKIIEDQSEDILDAVDWVYIHTNATFYLYIGIVSLNQ